MTDMILKMSLSVVVFVAATVVIWLIWRRFEKKTLWLKLLVGLLFGLCSVAASHAGVDYGSMLLNVRDIGPLAAGLFFDPLSGILAGIIGGVERYLAAVWWDLGYFTRIACSVSTCLAGFLAAALHVWIYQKKRPSVIHSFFLGAVMEVFHMYAVIVTNRNDVTMAYYVVRTVSYPMILFTAAGVALCSAMVLRLSGEYEGFTVFRRQAETPIFTQIQRWMLVVTAVVFSVNTWMTYRSQTRIAYEEVETRLKIHAYEMESIYERTRSVSTLTQRLNDENGRDDMLYLLVDRQTREVLNRNEFMEDGAAFTVDDEFRILNHLNGNPFTVHLDAFERTEMMGVGSLLGNRYYLLSMTLSSMLYENRDNMLTESVLSDILLFTTLYLLFAILVDRMVSRKLTAVNESLQRITSGHLEEEVKVNSSSEFASLSRDINTTVTALRGYIHAAEKRMEEELRLAASIQEAALPRNFSLPGDAADLYALMTPARHVGGDFYDFFYLDDRKTLVLVIADVSGKGIPAALFMMRAKTAIKNKANQGMNPGELLAAVNNILCEGNDAEMFVTVWLGMIDMDTGIMRCANAGHEYPVLAPAGGDYALVKDRHGMVLAAMEGIPMREYTLEMHHGDRLFVYTDGVPEAINGKEEAYGAERLVKKLNEMKDHSQEEILKAELQDIRDFAGEAEQFDDITMIGLTFR